MLELQFSVCVPHGSVLLNDQGSYVLDGSLGLRLAMLST